jgi:aspartate-semialdehyde dehydrogenase
VSKEELILKLKEYRGFPQEADLPSAPKQFIRYFEEDDRPQVKADVDYERGFGVTMGRLREDTLFDYKFIGLAHNTVRGAAGGAILMAETLVEMEYIQAK